MPIDDDLPLHCYLEHASLRRVELAARVFRAINVAVVTFHQNDSDSAHSGSSLAFIEETREYVAAEPSARWEDVGAWLARLMQQEFLALDSDGPDQVIRRLEFVRQLACLLFPNIEMLPVEDEIVRLHMWPYPFAGRGKA
jgi:hypothetical protein